MFVAGRARKAPAKFYPAEAERGNSVIPASGDTSIETLKGAIPSQSAFLSQITT